MADELIAALADLAGQASPGWAHIVRGPYPAALGEGRYGVEVRPDGGVLLLVDGPPSGLMRDDRPHRPTVRRDRTHFARYWGAIRVSSNGPEPTGRSTSSLMLTNPRPHTALNPPPQTGE